MKTVIVYESFYGNTAQVAEAIAEGMNGLGDIVFGRIDDLRPDAVAGADLVVAGGPTHAHGMATQATRRNGAGGTHAQPYHPTRDVLRDWMIDMPDVNADAATFDTRFHKPRWMTGSAAKGIAKRLTAKGCKVVATESFFVSGSEGPLEAGERERAVAFGRSLAERYGSRSAA